jgi:hypothetical protein
MKKSHRTESSGTGPEHANQEELSDNYGWPQPDFLSTEALQEILDTDLEPDFRSSRNRLSPGVVNTTEASGQTMEEEEDLSRHRRRLLKSIQTDLGLSKHSELCKHLGVSRSALYGMTKGDRTRYSEPALAKVLEKVGVSRSEWDSPPPPSVPEWLFREAVRQQMLLHTIESLRY